jgi:hypothetical protein
MKKLLFVCFIMLSLQCFAQDIRATTDDGKKVLLKNDGTWKLLNSDVSKNNSSNKNTPSTSTKELILKGNKVSIFYNPNLWQEKSSDTPTKTTLAHKDGDVYVMIIYERIEMTLEALKNIAINNAKAAAPDVKVTLDEDRIVNGMKIYCMKMEGTIQSIKFVYYGYYYAGKAGTLQLMTYTYTNLFSEYETDMSDILNGLVIKE